ncbi:hypothetical protein AQJ30_27600 [Streptomyces longwoodensis]|uniref:Phage tail protein n=1 Tax=Streptomyces longwoodensis TaxID=68231 RepID=A0A101QS72_9ACTN|nr:phage tail domain-containing protein [Streptomyces longwoodensis]KUN34836.1 hypothetical protein AQJ30_27600 [Streptomyces longwoodensis]
MPYTPGAALGGLSATLGGVTLGAVDAEGVAWHLQTLEGWDSSEVRAEYTDREADHGAWASPVYLGSRPITLGGKIVAPTQRLLERAMEQLRAAAGLTDTVLSVWETEPKQTVVRRSGKVLLQYETSTVATYSVMVTAADPGRYAVDVGTGTTGLPTTSGGLTPPLTPPLVSNAVTVSGEITAENTGTIPTRLLLTITGPADGPQVFTQMPDGTVVILSYTDVLYDGDQLVIDTAAKTCVLNGVVSRRRYLTVPSGWPAIPAQASVSLQFRARYYNPTAKLTAQWRSAWM